MQKKYIAEAATVLALVGGIGFTSANKVQAATHSFYWWEKPRTVRVTKNHKIYEIQGTIPRSQNYLIRTKTLKRGQIVKIHHVAEQTWIVQGKGLVNGYYKSRGRFWAANGMKGWYSLNLHPKSQISKSQVKTTKTNSNSLTGKNAKFLKFSGSYVYNDTKYNLDMKPEDTNYHPATSSNSARVTMTFDFRNKTHQPVNVADAINTRVKVMQDGTYFTLKTASGAPTILAHGNRMTPIKMYIEGNLNGQDPLTLVFQEDSSRKEDGVASVNLNNAEPTIKQTNNAPKNSASSSNNQSSSNTTSSSNQTNSSSTSSQFTGFPAGAGYLEKAKIIFSLSGDARKQADLQLMKDLGEVDSQGRPEVPIASFEAHLREMYDSVQRMSESIEHGGQTSLQFK